MKNFIIFAVIVCIFLVAAEAKFRNTGVRDQRIKELGPMRIPNHVHQRMQNILLTERLANGRLNLRADNRNGELIQPIINEQPNQYHNRYPNQNPKHFQCNLCNGDYEHAGENCC